MKLLPTLLLCLSLTGVAKASLGETPNEFRKRFGAGEAVEDAGTSTPDEGLRHQRFTMRGIQIEVLFNYISVGESYFPDAPLSEEQIQALLDANSEGHRWKEVAKRSRRNWVREDGAEADLTESCFIFKSKYLLEKEQSWNLLHNPNADSI